MVLESFISPIKAEKRPWELFFLGFLYASIAMFLSLWIFEKQTSLVMVFLTVIACTPLLFNAMRYEEYKDINISSEPNRLKEHYKILKVLIFLFLGFCVAFSIWYVFLPANTVDSIFSIQMQTINTINSKVAGNVLLDLPILEQIFLNNIKVLLFCLFFAFFYGAGAIFILTWNASVISAAIGNLIRINVAEYAKELGFSSMWAYFSIFSVSFLRYMIHGVPEISAYFVGGLAGSIISVATINHDFRSEKFKNVLLDTICLIVIAVIILVIAALMEVYLTPKLF
ncbi:MAG: stage II sporulation protein M [Candidatus Nanoarchaeia archaeon]|nr:stage II sporulation protein M [Candidatus Nanoarchaeia archaeon]MDD5587633.1 stage II sporulation protein M [Candidatus Nanoarchaeia archaeon]